MKMNKFFMLGLAGLAFAACSNEEEMGNQLPEGTGAVTINIVSPAMTRSIEDGTTDNSVKVTGPVTITLEAETGNNSITLDAGQLAVQNKVTFWNVKAPSKVTVSMNGGKSSYVEDDPTFFMTTPEDSEEKILIEPASIPAYGETTSFTLSAETASPGQKGGANYEIGANADGSDNSKVYQLYKATVQLAIPVARLEVSGIQHVITGTHEVGEGEENCAYKTLTIAGVYLDNVYPTGAGVIYADGKFPCVSGINPDDYCYDGTTATGTGAEAIWKDAAVNNNFLTVNAIWPETPGKAYSYYFFGAEGADNLPKFKIYFDTSEAQNAASPLPAPRYAMITKYKETEENGGGVINKFEPGHIYRITKAVLSDENIIGDEGGNTLYGVEVTVEEATWTVKTIEADWAQ